MAKEIRLKYLTDNGLAQLKEAFDSNIEYYKSKDQQYFLNYLNTNGYLQDTSYVIEDFTDKLIFTEDLDKDDLNNIKILYTAMKDIPTYVMMEDRFWAAQNHTIMWDYITKRSEGFRKESKDQRNKLYNSFFTHTKNGKKRGTYVNCVSRLWWAGKLSYDESRENPFELTEELCKTGFASTIVPFSSSNITGRDESRKAILTVVKELREQGKIVKRDDITYGLKYLNLIAGSSMLDVMSFDEIVELLRRYYGMLQ